MTNEKLKDGVPDANPISSARRFSLRRGDAAQLFVVVAGLVLVFSLARWMDAQRTTQGARVAQSEELYVSPETARRMSLGFNGLVADWYWLRALQFIGRKMDAYKGDINIDNLKPLGAENLAPLLEHATTLDPQFTAAYQYGAVVLPAIDVEAALKLTRKGIEANPQSWRLRQHLGYIYWKSGRFREAADAYRDGARQPGAPAWMNAMAAQMELGGGSPETAREIYTRMYAEADDEQVKVLALKRLLQLDSLAQRERIRRVLADYKSRAGRCPGAWRDVAAAALRTAGLKTDASGAPLDPTGVPYVLDASACDAALDARSEIPQN
ncbi:MAG TPA: hypothetical protein VM934_15085 [Pyrinomonadaceae bacterium]|nr:hypothetical protein [Pyrinomonadaceae bacterium]